MTESMILKVGAHEAGERLDKYVSANVPELTRSKVQKMIHSARITKNGRPCDKKDQVAAGDEITVCLPEPELPIAVGENIPLDIVYEDDDLLVINKAQGMVVHPGAGNRQGTLANAVVYHCQGKLSTIGGEVRPGIVHRLDKDTSGLILVAKNDAAHLGLAAQIKEHQVTRIYEAILIGTPQQMQGVVDAPIGRHPTKRKQMAITDHNARNARTHYRVLASCPGFSYVECELETGRTHQIRVHMASLGHPVLGDTVYGPLKQKFGLTRQCLNARQISFTHPRTGERMCFTVATPAYFQEILTKLQLNQ